MAVTVGPTNVVTVPWTSDGSSRCSCVGISGHRDVWHPFQRVEVPEVVSVYCGISAYLLPTSLGRQDPLVASQAAVT